MTNFSASGRVWAGLAFQSQEWRLKRTVPAVLNRIIQGSDHRYFSRSAASAPYSPSLQRNCYQRRIPVHRFINFRFNTTINRILGFRTQFFGDIQCTDQVHRMSHLRPIRTHRHKSRYVIRMMNQLLRLASLPVHPRNKFRIAVFHNEIVFFASFSLISFPSSISWHLNNTNSMQTSMSLKMSKIPFPHSYICERHGNRSKAQSIFCAYYRIAVGILIANHKIRN